MATALSIKRARKILGKTATGLSDKELEKDIKLAEILKNLFFSQYVRRSKSKYAYNKETNGKS